MKQNGFEKILRYNYRKNYLKKELYIFIKLF